MHSNGWITSLKNGYLLWFNGKPQIAAIDRIFMTLIVRKAFSVLVDWKQSTDDCPLEIFLVSVFHVNDCAFICQPDRRRTVRTFANKSMERHEYTYKLSNHVLDSWLPDSL